MVIAYRLSTKGLCRGIKRLPVTTATTSTIARDQYVPFYSLIKTHLLVRFVHRLASYETVYFLLCLACPSLSDGPTPLLL